MKLLLYAFLALICGAAMPIQPADESPRWYRPNEHSGYMDFYDQTGRRLGRLDYDWNSSKAEFTAPGVALRFRTKGFFDGEIKIARHDNRNQIGIIRKTNRKRNRLELADGRTYHIDLKNLTISEDGVVLLAFQRQTEDEFVVQSYVSDEQEMLQLSAILMYGRIAWVYGGGV